MKTFQDLSTGELWAFDDDVDINAIPNAPKTLTEKIIPRPDEFHDWNGHGWTLNLERKKKANNEAVLAQIADLEDKQMRQVRELLLDASNAFARNKLANLDAQIAALRAQLMP